MGILVACGPTIALSEAEQGLLAWAKLNYDQKIWSQIERIFNNDLPRFESISVVDEHRIRQEATSRGIRLPR